MKNRRRTAQMVAATSLAAVGTLGAALAPAAPAGAASSTKIYACYSTKTNALSYDPKGAKCASGETQISWNASGPQGSRGAQGTKGTQGANGAQGSAGAQGAQGAQGVKGPQGPQGVLGAQGAQGATGPQGATGAQGSIGSQGSQGKAGTTGTQGAQGSTGAQGPAGPTGYIAIGGRTALPASARVTSSSYTPVQVVVARITPRSGSYDVTAEVQADWAGVAVKPANSLGCWVRDESRSSTSSRTRIESSTQHMYTPITAGSPSGHAGALGVTGFLSAGPNKATLSLICEAKNGTGEVSATLTATTLTTAVTDGSQQSTPFRNRFSKVLRPQAPARRSEGKRK